MVGEQQYAASPGPRLGHGLMQHVRMFKPYPVAQGENAPDQRQQQATPGTGVPARTGRGRVAVFRPCVISFIIPGQTGDPVGEWLYLWYRTAKAYSALALDLYGVTPGQVA